ncbi:TIM barrel protein [Candidatus Nitrosocaldus cavascurensis]|jgi:deoxyribonuclease-4|uniref:Endonuclease IV n=1 Tax=Candidatus Nitrosocaldus cavascurensis TaxID=2058097 RepID=A0A2K5APU9_9ARCH|nr:MULTISPECIES: TIM barrel protein [Candidatus Nitrosocaldus]SPC33688.1 Endonuclease IV [Candidatus Nitrosocaldus cavascurensis]
MRIYIGTQGLPATARGHGIEAGLRRLHELGLNALEVDFAHGIYLSMEESRDLGRLADELGIRLSIHAPYYINLCSEDEEVIRRSKHRILECVERGEVMHADTIAIHSAFYGKRSKEEAYAMVRAGYESIVDEMRSMGIKHVRLGAETMARRNQFGTLDEVLRLYKDLNGWVRPYVDFAHIFARNDGRIDYADVIDRLLNAGLEYINAHFTGLARKGYRYVDVHRPIGEPQFEPLALEIVRRRLDITIICESPLLELDCLRMRNILEFMSMELSLD